MRPLLPEIRVPTLVLHPSRSTAIPAQSSREIAAQIPGAELHAYKADAYVDASEESRESRWSVITRFLDARLSALPTSGPGGFQTILFTDIESSTALTQRLGDEGAQELLRGHNKAVRAALEEHGGREVKHTGDGIMASFPSAVAAVTAALAMQRELAGGEVRVRIGLNAGEPIAEDDDLFGTAVQLAARITDRAEPGQVLVSNVVRELCAGKTFEFTSVGEATLKGFDEPVALYEVMAG